MSVHGFLQRADTSARSRMLTLDRKANEESSHKHAADYMEIHIPERNHGSRFLDFRFHPFRTLSWKNARRLTQKGRERVKKVLETCVFSLLPINTTGPASSLVSPSAWTAGMSLIKLSEQLEKHWFHVADILPHKYISRFSSIFWGENDENGWFLKKNKQKLL